MWQGWVTFGVGLWLIASGIRADFQSPFNLYICGVLAVVFGFLAYKSWLQISVGFIGVVSILMALAVNSEPALSIVYYFIGGLIVILSLLSAPQNEWKHLLE